MNRLFRLIAALGAGATAALVAGDAAHRPDLVGRIASPDGQPITNAQVFVYTAGPRTGTGIVCPSCYADCGKRATTDGRGSFTIPALDPDLLFRLLVLAPGYESTYVPKTDPAAGEKAITLAPRDRARLEAPTRIRGLIMDASGKALAGVTISPEGVTRGAGTQWGGSDTWVDPLAVTDLQGRFWLYCTNGVDRVDALVEGRGVAKRWVALKPGNDHLIRMQEGVLVTGRIARDGRGLAGVRVGAVTVDRTCGSFFRCDELATDAQGNFAIPDVPPGQSFALYACMDSLKGRGAVECRSFPSGPSGGTVTLGTLEVGAGHRLAGRVVLSDGQPVPSGTRLMLGRELAWDHTEAETSGAGRFEFTDVPAESVSMSVRVKGYKLSKRNPSLDWYNGGLVGRVTGDLPEFTILLEPGEWRHNGGEGDPPNGEGQPTDKPLRSAVVP